MGAFSASRVHSQWLSAEGPDERPDQGRRVEARSLRQSGAGLEHGEALRPGSTLASERFNAS
jgi:hypothetical protein